MRSAMQHRHLALTFATLALLDAPRTSAAQARQLSVDMRPSTVVTDAQSAQVILTVEGSTLTGATLSLEPPPGFKVEPQSVQLTGAAPMRRIAVLQRVDSAVAS